MKRVIIDFDNTMGIRGCDVDDGLALLYLLGNPDRCAVEAACTSFGNSDIETVTGNTRRLFDQWGLDLPIYRGYGAPVRDGEPISEASRYLARAAAERPGELSILVTGSTGNLLGAQLVDPGFFRNVREIVHMGGITQTLVINGRIMDELNFSCDPRATLAILGSGARVSTATAQNCLPAFFSRETFAERFAEDSWLSKTIDYWFADMNDSYRWGGFAVWDMVAAAILIKPELFDGATRNVTLNERFLSVGLLEEAAPDAPQAVIGTPSIRDARALIVDALDSWERALTRIGLE